jgi:hypothetical protein
MRRLLGIALIAILAAPAVTQSRTQWQNVDLWPNSLLDLQVSRGMPILLMVHQPQRGYYDSWGRLNGWMTTGVLPYVDSIDVVGMAAMDSRPCAVGATVRMNVNNLGGNNLTLMSMKMTSGSAAHVCPFRCGSTSVDPWVPQEFSFSYSDAYGATGWTGCGVSAYDAPDMVAVALRIRITNSYP